MEHYVSKIFYISGALNFGAPGRIVEQIGLLAQKLGFEVLVAHSSRNENPSKLPHIPVTTKFHEVLHALGAKLFDLHGLLSTKQTKALIRKIEAFNPDIIHLHNLHGYYLDFKALFEYLGSINKPVVWTLHDCWSFTGRCFHFEGTKCYKWRDGCYDCKAEPGYTVSAFCDKSKKLYALKKELFNSIDNLTLVPVSSWLASYVKESYLSEKAVQVIYNGVDLDKFKPLDKERLQNKHSLQGKYVILGVASPWNQRKGLCDFLTLREKLDESYAIILVGLTEKQIQSLPEGIIGISRTESQNELAEYYSLADVFCNLTYLDTFPTVNLEALACGTPVITYRTGGSPEAVDDKTGVVVEQGNIEGVVQAVKRVNKHQLSPNDCRERAERLYDKDSCFNKYIELYNSLLS